MDFQAVKARLEQNRFTVTVFSTGQEAADYLNRAIDGKTVGCGGSMTLQTLGLYESLAAHNTLFYHGAAQDREAAIAGAAGAQVYLCSVNAVAADEGALLNIDGTGNRVSATLFGHEKVYFVVGRNKIAPDFHQALWRARNIAAPKNAQRLQRRTPCAAKGDRCYNCDSPERICNGLVVFWKKMSGVGDMEVVLVDEELGY